MQEGGRTYPLFNMSVFSVTRSPLSTAILTALTDAGIEAALIVLSLGLGMATVMRANTSSFRRPAESFASTLHEKK